MSIGSRNNRPVQGLGNSGAASTPQRLQQMSEPAANRWEVSSLSQQETELETLQRAMQPGPITGRDINGGDALYPGRSLTTNRSKQVVIDNLDYGYVVKVGCHSFAISSHKKLTKLLAEYLANPAETEKKWFANQLAIKRNISV